MKILLLESMKTAKYDNGFECVVCSSSKHDLSWLYGLTKLKTEYKSVDGT